MSVSGCTDRVMSWGSIQEGERMKDSLEIWEQSDCPTYGSLAGSEQVTAASAIGSPRVSQSALRVVPDVPIASAITGDW